MNVFDTFQKKSDFLICVDSDGCAMDTMNCKHFHCFGPCMVTEWELEQWKEPILKRWNEINLFQMTRGINRFKGLAMALKEIDRQYTAIEGVDALVDWVETAPALSNDAVAKAADCADLAGKKCLKKALSWSKAVNTAIVALPEEVKIPFAGAKDGLTAAKQIADVAVVSSANRDAVTEEWSKHGLLEQTDILLTQDCGSKSRCIAEMLKFGYDPAKVVMVGDAPGDRDAAEQNGVWFFPILVGKEQESWAEFQSTALPHLLNGTYADYQAEKNKEFLASLGG